MLSTLRTKGEWKWSMGLTVHRFYPVVEHIAYTIISNMTPKPVAIVNQPISVKAFLGVVQQHVIVGSSTYPSLSS